jgi:hypothetical protein
VRRQAPSRAAAEEQQKHEAASAAKAREEKAAKAREREEREAWDMQRVINLPIASLRKVKVALDEPEVQPEDAKEVAPAPPLPRDRSEVKVARVPRTPVDAPKQLYASDEEAEEREPANAASDGEPIRTLEPEPVEGVPDLALDEEELPPPEEDPPPRRARGRAPRERRVEDEPDDEDEDTEEPEDAQSEEEDVPPTEEELQDEYRALLKRLKRNYKYLDIDIPAPGTSSKRLQRMHRYYVDEVSTAEGLEKYKIMLVVGFVIMEVIGKKLNLPCDGYAELQKGQIANYHSMLVEFGDRDYFGFARGYPIEVRLIGMMLINMGILVVGRLLLEPATMTRLISAVTSAGNREIPPIALDNPNASPPVPGAAAAPADATGGMLTGIMSMLGGMFGGGGPPARERSDQAQPTYQRRRRRAAA